MSGINPEDLSRAGVHTGLIRRVAKVAESNNILEKNLLIIRVWGRYTLTDWEHDFIGSVFERVMYQRRILTDKQNAALEKIIKRLGDKYGYSDNQTGLLDKQVLEHKNQEVSELMDAYLKGEYGVLPVDLALIRALIHRQIWSGHKDMLNSFARQIMAEKTLSAKQRKVLDNCAKRYTLSEDREWIREKYLAQIEKAKP